MCPVGKAVLYTLVYGNSRGKCLKVCCKTSDIVYVFLAFLEKRAPANGQWSVWCTAKEYDHSGQILKGKASTVIYAKSAFKSTS